MALTPSNMLALGTQAPRFTLIDVTSDTLFSLDANRSRKGLVVLFICNHCPYVKHILSTLLRVIREYQAQGIEFIAINSNNVDDYPEDHPDKMRELAQAHHFTFPYLFDETQTTAKEYHAACTPDFFVFDKALSCVYRGRFDDTSPGKLNNPVTGNELKQALDHLLLEQPISQQQYPSLGCNIKWKKN